MCFPKDCRTNSAQRRFRFIKSTARGGVLSSARLMFFLLLPLLFSCGQNNSNHSDSLGITLEIPLGGSEKGLSKLRAAEGEVIGEVHFRVSTASDEEVVGQVQDLLFGQQAISVTLNVPTAVPLTFSVEIFDKDGPRLLSGSTVKTLVPANSSDPIVIQLFPEPIVEFPIAVKTHIEFGASLAFDGENYLVGLWEDTGNGEGIQTQRVSPAGSLVGPPTDISSLSGDALGVPFVAFDGANYLLAAQISDEGVRLDGQIISTAGALDGEPFNIGTSSIIIEEEKGGMAFGGGNYLVVIEKDDQQVFGYIVTPDGQVGRPFLVSQNGHTGVHNVSFDGVNFLVVWADGQSNAEVKGRFVDPTDLTGKMGEEFTVHSGQFPSDEFVTLAFGESRYLVLWQEEVGGAGSSDWDIFGQLVDPAGTLIGERIAIAQGAGPQVFPNAVFDGEQFLVSWTEAANLFDIKIQKRAFDLSGNPLGAESTLFVSAGDGRFPWYSRIGFNDTKYFAVVNRGRPGDDPFDIKQYQNQDVFGAVFSLLQLSVLD